VSIRRCNKSLQSRGLKLSFIRGPHVDKKGLAGRIKRKNASAGHKRWLKVTLYYKNSSFSNNLSNFNDVAGHTNMSGGSHAAHVFETPAFKVSLTFPKKMKSNWKDWVGLIFHLAKKVCMYGNFSRTIYLLKEEKVPTRHMQKYLFRTWRSFWAFNCLKRANSF